MKESAATKFKTFQIPVDWMLETGITSQVSKYQDPSSSFPVKLIKLTKQNLGFA